MTEQVELFEPLDSKEESCPWEKRSLGSFLTPINRSVSKPDKKFLGLGIRSHGKGTFLKPNSDPDKINMKTLYQVKENDLIVNITFAWEGAVAIVEPEDHGALVSHRFPTYKFETDLVIPEFFKYVIIQDRFKYLLRIISPGGAGRNRVLNKTDFLKLEVEIPPLPEQKKIARILGTWDRAIDLTERLIEAKERQKKGLMQQLLTGKMRFIEFVQSDKMQQSKVGLIPKDWDILTLKKICLKFSNGGTPSRKIAEYWNGKIPWITGADFLEQKIATVRRFITQEAIKASSTNLMPKGSLLVVTRTGVGKLALAPFDVAISQDITGVYPESEKVDSEYLFSYLDAFKGRLERLSQGTSINGITRDLLAKQIIPLPSLVEQRKIATVLSACDREIELLSRKLDVLKEEKKGLMQQLLTGKVRVKI